MVYVHNSPPSSFTTSLVVVSKMSHTPSSHSVASSYSTGFIVCDICNNQVMNECIYTKNYISMYNLKYCILLMGLADAERPYLAMARMEDHQGGNLVPVAEEVRRYSS